VSLWSFLQRTLKAEIKRTISLENSMKLYLCHSLSSQMKEKSPSVVGSRTNLTGWVSFWWTSLLVFELVLMLFSENQKAGLCDKHVRKEQASTCNRKWCTLCFSWKSQKALES
jgi:hypothetical protein